MGSSMVTMWHARLWLMWSRHGGDGGRFAATGDAGEDDQALGRLAERVIVVSRQMQFLEGRMRRVDPARNAGAPALPEHVDAEPVAGSSHVREIHARRLLEFAR